MINPVFDTIWQRQISDKLIPENWDKSYFYSAATYFTEPLAHAFGDLGTENQRAEFGAHFTDFLANGFGDDVGWLAKGQYLSLAQQFIEAEELADGGSTDLTSGLANLILQEVLHEWVHSTDHDWRWEGWTGREEGINSKLESGEGRITDGDMYLLSLGAGLAKREVTLEGAASHDLAAMVGLADTVITQVGVLDDSGHWTFPSEDLLYHPDHAVYFWDGRGLIPNFAPASDGMSWDTSHASRWPAWFETLVDAASSLGLSTTTLQKAQAGFRKVFEELVLYESVPGSGVWLTTNFADGHDGVYRWGYQSFPSDMGYGASQTSGTFLVGRWTALGSQQVTQAYEDLLTLGGFDPGALEFFNEPVRTGPTDNDFDWQNILESGDILLWLAMASGTTQIDPLGTVSIAQHDTYVFVDPDGQLSLTDILPDLSAFSGQMISLLDVAHQTGSDGTGNLVFDGIKITSGDVLTIPISHLANGSYVAGENAMADRLYWQILSDGSSPGSTWRSIDIGRTNTAPELTPVALIGDRNDVRALSEAVSFADVDGDTSGRFQLFFRDSNDTAGFYIQTHKLSADVTHNFTADQMKDVTFVLDGGAKYWVRQTDGGAWSNWESLIFEANNHAPIVTISDQEATNLQWIRLSDVLSSTDLNGDEMTTVQLWGGDDGQTWWVNGAFVDASDGFLGLADDKIWIRADSVSSQQTLWVRLNDGSDWSDWTDFTLETRFNAAPEVMIPTLNVRAQSWILFDDLYNVFDADGDAVQKIKLWDSDGDASWWADRSIVDASSGYETGNLNGIWLRGDDQAGAQKIWIRVFDGHHWSDWESFSLVTTSNAAPIADIEDQLVFLDGDPVAAKDIVTITDTDGDDIVRFQLWDSDGPDNWQIDGLAVDATRGFYVDNLDSVSLSADGNMGTQTLWLRAYDGAIWSEWDSFVLVTS